MPPRGGTISREVATSVMSHPPPAHPRTTSRRRPATNRAIPPPTCPLSAIAPSWHSLRTNDRGPRPPANHTRPQRRILRRQRGSPMTLKRRQFLTGGATALAAGAVASPAIAQSAPEIKWRLTSSFPRILDTIFGTAQTMSKYIAEATDNRFQVQTFPAGEIVPGLQALDAVQNGSVECAQTPVYFYFGKDPTLAFGTGVPFGLNARLSHSWWHFGGGAEIINETLAKFNTVGFPCGNSGCQMGGFFRKELNDLEDLKGLKFRIGGLGGQVLAKLGIVPQQIAPGDVYPALEKGTIDAAEFVGPYDDEKLGFHKVAKFYYFPGWWEGSAMLHLCINLERWNALPKHYQSLDRKSTRLNSS